jgi:hypothetical protein
MTPTPDTRADARPARDGDGILEGLYEDWSCLSDV